MVFFNWATMQMAAKIVYYGPGLCGKTTNLSYIYAKTAPGSRGEMVSLETETDRTLFFDLLPLEVGKVGGFRTRLQLYTVPGQVFYNTTRKLVLKGVDGMVFVADSQRPMAEANVESLQNLEENLLELGLALDAIPMVMQYNKRDLKNILTVDELNNRLNPEGRWEYFESVAVDGSGVFESLKAITKLTLRALRRRMVNPEAAAAAAPAPPSPGPGPAAGRAHVAFSPAALAAAAAEGLGTPASAPAHRAPHAAAASPPAEPVKAAPPVAVEAPPPPIATAVAPPASSSPEAPTVEIPVAEDAEEAPVEFATSPEPEPEKVVDSEIRHVKVSTSLDILAELETLRKSGTFQPEPRPDQPSAPSLDLDALLQGSVNSRQEVKRRVDEKVGNALGLARRCTVNIQLVDERGHPVKAVSPVEVELKRGERVRHLALTLVVNLKGE
ncbi:MAG TPA: GTPase domain-containing protein [Thermoanaerobaculaceae bacterium]|nr:GTPase domain-containing protein [Thermoanaerobaculaceae bacterium]